MLFIVPIVLLTAAGVVAIKLVAKSERSPCFRAIISLLVMLVDILAIQAIVYHISPY